MKQQVPGTKHQKHLKWQTQNVDGEITSAAKQLSTETTGLNIEKVSAQWDIYQKLKNIGTNQSLRIIWLYIRKKGLLPWCFTDTSY